MEAKRTRGIEGIHMGGHLYIAHLLFLDNIMLFCDESI